MAPAEGGVIQAVLGVALHQKGPVGHAFRTVHFRGGLQRTLFCQTLFCLTGIECLGCPDTARDDPCCGNKVIQASGQASCWACCAAEGRSATLAPHVCQCSADSEVRHPMVTIGALFDSTVIRTRMCMAHLWAAVGTSAVHCALQHRCMLCSLPATTPGLHPGSMLPACDLERRLEPSMQ